MMSGSEGKKKRSVGAIKTPMTIMTIMTKIRGWAEYCHLCHFCHRDRGRGHPACRGVTGTAENMFHRWTCFLVQGGHPACRGVTHG